MVEEQLQDLADAARILSFDFSERPWDYVQTHAPKVAVAIWSMPGGDRAAAEDRAACLRQLGPLRRGDHDGRRRCGAAARRAIAYSPVAPGPVVDTLGAGDAFIARLLVGLASAEAAGPARPQRDPVRDGELHVIRRLRAPHPAPRPRGRDPSHPERQIGPPMSPVTRTTTCLAAALATLTFAACGAPSTGGATSAKPADLTTPKDKSGTLTVVTKFADPKYAPYFVERREGLRGRQPRRQGRPAAGGRPAVQGQDPGAVGIQAAAGRVLLLGRRLREQVRPRGPGRRPDLGHRS